jgi:hypothetical protein
VREGNTTCLEPGCPESVPIGSCWCWEHIHVCFEPIEDECEHPAHYCDAAVHYCERHAEGR